MNGGVAGAIVTEQGMGTGMVARYFNFTEILVALFNSPSVLLKDYTDGLTIDDGLMFLFESRVYDFRIGNDSKGAVCFYTIFNTVQA